MNKKFKITIFILTLLPFFYNCNKEIYIKPHLITSIEGTLYYYYDKGKFETFNFMFNSSESKELIKIINTSERGNHTPLSHRLATIHLKVKLKEDDCKYYEIMISKEIGTYIYEFSDCYGSKFLVGRFKNDKLGSYLIENLNEKFNMNDL